MTIICAKWFRYSINDDTFHKHICDNHTDAFNNYVTVIRELYLFVIGYNEVPRIFPSTHLYKQSSQDVSTVLDKIGSTGLKMISEVYLFKVS